jgi:hypothetical protein
VHRRMHGTTKENDDVMHERCMGAYQNMRPQTLDPSLTSIHSVNIEFRPNYADMANPYMCVVCIDILHACMHTST